MNIPHHYNLKKLSLMAVFSLFVPGNIILRFTKDVVNGEAGSSTQRRSRGQEDSRHGNQMKVTVDTSACERKLNV